MCRLVQKELDKFNNLTDDDTYSYNSRFIHKQGDWKYFRTQGTVLRRNNNGNPASLLFIAQDITDQLQTEEEASAAKDLLSETETLLHFGTWTWDISLHKVIWSNGLYNLLGYDEGYASSEPCIEPKFYSNMLLKKDATDFETAIENSLIDEDRV